MKRFPIGLEFVAQLADSRTAHAHLLCRFAGRIAYRPLRLYRG
jgi:hypothetical protein